MRKVIYTSSSVCCFVHFYDYNICSSTFKNISKNSSKHLCLEVIKRISLGSILSPSYQAFFFCPYGTVGNILFIQRNISFLSLKLPTKIPRLPRPSTAAETVVQCGLEGCRVRVEVRKVHQYPRSTPVESDRPQRTQLVRNPPEDASRDVAPTVWISPYQPGTAEHRAGAETSRLQEARPAVLPCR